jgi:N-acetylglucosamine-6-sulfatase
MKGAIARRLAPLWSLLLLAPALPAQGAARFARPNIVFILADDMRQGDLDVMPRLQRLLADSGTTFSRYIVGVSLCCPSRATALAGRYAHNTGVRTNRGENGGYGAAVAHHLEQSTVAAWLERAGYRTGLFGKYLNGYPIEGRETAVPPGWTEWASPVEGHPYTEYNYTLNHNGRLEIHGRRPYDYGTDVYRDLALDFVRRSARAGAPFFLYFAPYAPHEPATPAPRHLAAFPGAMAPRTPGYNEVDVNDKPAYVARSPLMSPRVRRAVDDLYRRRIRSLQAVDEAVAAVVDSLAALGILGRTYLVFSSDNGFHLGQHRLAAGKRSPYEEDIRVPLIVRGPGVAAGATIPALAGVPVPTEVDGRSLVPWLSGARPSAWRTAVLLDHWATEAAPVWHGRVGDELLLPELEPADLDERSELGMPTPDDPLARTRGVGRLRGIPAYHGLRTERYAYVEYRTGERELYDLLTDPDELSNLARQADPALLASLAARLAALRRCHGDGCRAAEDGRAP